MRKYIKINYIFIIKYLRLLLIQEKVKKEINNFYFEFEIKDEKYVISFDSKGKTFIYEVNLEVDKRIINIRRKIKQKKEYY